MMQNYAKFDSRIANESIIEKSIGYNSPIYQNDSEIINSIYYLIGNLFELFFVILAGLVFVLVIFLFIYIIISLFTKGGEKTLLELKKLSFWIVGIFKIIFLRVYNFFKKILLFFWARKNISIFIILVLCLINFSSNTINGKSKILKLDKIQPGFVGVDLKNNKIFEPGYQLFSPIKTNYFLSPTNNFDFEIAEVTANTKEDLGVTLDYRVGFKIKNGKRLDFYKTYGAKNIRLVSSDVVMPRLLETIKGIIRNYGFRDISSKHNEIKNITLKEANKVLLPIGIELQDITILDIRLPKSYLNSKEDLLKSENEFKLAEARLQAQKKESEKRILEAENNKKVKIIEAQAIAEYNRIITSEKIDEGAIEMKKLELQKLKIEKWDGKMPAHIEGNFGL